jgi:predicted RND superfamily exporter protein
MDEPLRVRGSSAGPRVEAYVRWTLRHGRVLWAIALLLFLPAAYRTALLYVHLKSDIEELLPRKAESVAAIDELRSRMPGLRYLGVIVDTGTPENVPAAEKFLDDLAVRIRAYPPNLVKRVKTGIGDERRFFERHAPLYADLEDLEKVRDRLETERDSAVSRELGLDLDGPPDVAVVALSGGTSVDLSDIEAKYRAKEKEAERFPNDRFSSREKKASLLLMEVAELTTGADLGNELIGRVRHDIADLGGTDRYAPGMRIGYTGDVAIDVEELAALVQDLTASSLVVVALVLAVLLVFYRWWRSVPALLLPLGLAATYAFALVTLPPLSITHLNSNTAFLGSVIVGNGINFGIILLARYVEERRRGADVEHALAVAVWGSRTGTLVAALAAAGAYGSLALTQFRGFQQFGIIGGIGMLVCWASAYLLGVPLIAWLDRTGSSARVKRRSQPKLMQKVASLVTRHPGTIVVAALALTFAAALRVRGFGHDSIEYDFSRLRRADSHVSGEAYWGAKMDDLLGRYLTPLVVLTDAPEQAARTAHALRAAAGKPPLSGVIDSVVAIDDLVPKDQAAKLAVVRQLRADLTPRVRAKLSPDQREIVERYFQNASLDPIGPADLPPSVTSGLAERDGSFDKAVLVYPHPSQATWQGPAILEMTGALRTVAKSSALPSDRPARLAGSIPLSADIISSIESDGPFATAAALFAVVLLVVFIFRFTLATPAIVGSLLLAVLWLLGATMALGVKINFANFIAFPITFGIGVDYAVNVMARYRETDPPNVVDAIKSTGGAVVLCSCTTIIGYGSLLFAQNRALFLFGVVAVLGELACLITATVVMPAVLVLLRRSSSPELGSLPHLRS